MAGRHLPTSQTLSQHLMHTGHNSLYVEHRRSPLKSVVNSKLDYRDGILERHFQSGFLCKNSSLLRLEVFLVFYPQNAIHEQNQVFLFRGFFVRISKIRVRFSLKSATERTVNSMKQKTRVFCYIDVQEFHLRKTRMGPKMTCRTFSLLGRRLILETLVFLKGLRKNLLRILGKIFNHM